MYWFCRSYFGTVSTLERLLITKSWRYTPINNSFKCQSIYITDIHVKQLWSTVSSTTALHHQGKKCVLYITTLAVTYLSNLATTAKFTMIKFIHEIDILYISFFLLGFLTVLWVLLYWGMSLFNIRSLLIFVNVRNAQSITSKAFNQSEKSEANKTHIRLYPDNNICKLGLSWSYGSWNWKYICNQCLLSIIVRGQIPLMAGCTWYNIYKKVERHDILLKVVLNIKP